jgi:RNA polymerase sigma-70 factor (sigma-E family)
MFGGPPGRIAFSFVVVRPSLRVRATIGPGQVVVPFVSAFVRGGMRADGFSDFVRARGTALHRTAYLLTGDWALAEDLLQTALAKVYLRWDRIDDHDGYLRRVLVTTYASWWRRRWRGELPHDVLPDVEAHDRWAEVDARTALHEALGRLPRRMRAVIVMRFHEDMTEAAVAEALGVSVGTVKSQTAKALAKLRGDSGLTGYATAAKEA